MQNKTMKRCLAALVAAILVGGVAISTPATVIAYDYETVDDLPTREPEMGAGFEWPYVPDDTSLNEIAEDSVVIDVGDGALVSINNGGVWYDNSGTISINSPTGFVSVNDGTIVDNYGLVSNHGCVINNFDDASLTGTAPVNQYWSVTLAAFDNGAAEFDEVGFVYKGITEKNYLLDNANAETGENVASAAHKTGTITITPENGYRVSETTGGVAPTTCQYSVARSGNGCIITISAVTGVTSISLGQLNLAITAIQEEVEEELGEDVVIRIAPSIQITEDESGNNRSVTEAVPVAGNVITAAQVSAMIESALAAAPDATVLDINLGNDPSLTADSLIALCEKNNVAKSCHFTHKGMKFVLFIPAVDPTSAAYQQCKALLDAEEGKQAGPIRLSLLFKPVGFNCLGE